VRGPFNALLRSPELATGAEARRMVRYRSSIPEALKEFAILVTARYWSAQYEWHAHHAHAMKRAGSAARRRAGPGTASLGMSDQEGAIHDFARSCTRRSP